MSRIPIRARLTAWSVVVLALILTGLGAFVVTRLRSDLTGAIDRDLRNEAAQIALGYQREGSAEFLDTSHTVLPGSADGESAAQILTASGAVAHRVGAAGLARPPPLAGRLLGRSLGRSRVVTSSRIGPQRRHVRLIALPVTSKGRRQVLVVAQSLASVDHAVQRVFVLLLVGGTGALVLVAAGAWWIARKALRPVEQMVGHADSIDIDELSQRLAVPPADDELSHLATTLNSMLDRLERGVQAREQLIADASHELRAPLAAMRSELDVSLRLDTLDEQARSVLESAREEVIRMSRIVDNLLTLARIDAGRLELLVGMHDVRQLVRSAARVHHTAARTANVSLQIDGEPLRLPGDRDRLEQVIGNLVENAIRAAAPDGAVSITTWRDAGHGGIAVTDTGPGIPADLREAIFERFAREDRSRGRDGGAGLGLAICRDIVQAHHGRIWIEDIEPHGSRFVVALPLREGNGEADGEDQPAASIRSPTAIVPPSRMSARRPAR